MTHTTVNIIAHTANHNWPGAEIVTFELYAPRFLLAEINTHGVIAKSAASSRAIPSIKRLDLIKSGYFIPDVWEENKPGMSSTTPLDEDKQAAADDIWRDAMNYACERQQELDDLGVHKQWTNRLTETFAYVKQVVTATELDNFFELRLGAAQPEFQELAHKMLEALNRSDPVKAGAHLPYVLPEEKSKYDMSTCYTISAARCARVSYKLFDGRPANAEADIALANRLLADKHMSPFDHPATADQVSKSWADEEYYWQNPRSHGRYWGWIPYRYGLEKRGGIMTRRDSFASL